MLIYYNILLFIVTMVGGSIPIWVHHISDKRVHYLLAFSGSFLLSITFLHLLPESFSELGGGAGLLLLAGFFLQMLIQRLTHGVEHGHGHIGDHEHDHHMPLMPILIGLTIHAFMEGLPLGFHYNKENTGMSLYLAVAAHKLPEAMLATALVMHVKNKQQAIIFLLLFSAVTPFASSLASVTSRRYDELFKGIAALLPVVAGAFIHIATTIFYESGTKQHKLTLPKIFAILLGLSIGLLTLAFE